MYYIADPHYGSFYAPRDPQIDWRKHKPQVTDMMLTQNFFLPQTGDKIPSFWFDFPKEEMLIKCYF